MEFVDFNLANKLKEKGFKKKCFKHFYPNSNDWFLSSCPECCNYSSYVDAPTISQILKWLREEKEIYIIIEPYPTMSTKNKICWSWHFKWNSDGVYMDNIFSDNKSYTTFEEAALAAIKYVSDNLI